MGSRWSFYQGVTNRAVSQPEQQRDDNNQFAQQYHDSEFINAVESLEMPLTKDVHEEVGCSYSLADYRLKELEEAGVVEKQEIGNANIWTVVE